MKNIRKFFIKSIKNLIIGRYSTGSMTQLLQRKANDFSLGFIKKIIIVVVYFSKKKLRFPFQRKKI